MGAAREIEQPEAEGGEEEEEEEEEYDEEEDDEEDEEEEPLAGGQGAAVREGKEGGAALPGYEEGEREGHPIPTIHWGRGRPPPHNALGQDAVRGRGAPLKPWLVCESHWLNGAPLPTIHRGRGRPPSTPQCTGAEGASLSHKCTGSGGDPHPTMHWGRGAPLKPWLVSDSHWLHGAPPGPGAGGMTSGSGAALGHPGGHRDPLQYWQSPWNIMIKHRLVQRRGRRSQMMTSFTDPVVSMDLLRAVLQPTINNEIQAVFGKYMKFFQKAAGNVRENVGEDVDTEQLIHETCRNCLEQAKLLFCDGKKSVARLPHEVPTMKRAKPVEEEVNQHGSPIPKKRKGRPPGQSQLSDPKPVGMNTGKTKSCEPVPRDGPKWDPARIKDSTPLVLGSRANKALGMGGTRGRLYIKHPHMFKYAADPQDKHWLAEQQHMRATGGKMAYLLLEEDIRDLAASDEYRGSSELKLDELKPFIPPPWMTMKVRKYMETLRNEGEQPPPPARPLPLEGAPES